MTIEEKEFRADIVEHIDREKEHIEDKFNSQFKPIEKLLDRIEISIKELDAKIYNDAQLREIAFKESIKSQKKFWNNFRWFIGVTLILVVTIFITGVDMWSSVKDYNNFKNKTTTKIERNTSDINTIKTQTFNADVAEDIKHIRDKLK